MTKPWIHDGAITIIEKYCENNKNVSILEFGSGYSTLYFEYLSDYVFSIEHNKEWYNKIKPLLVKNTRYKLIDINYVPSVPSDKKFYNSEKLQEIFNEVDGEFFDIILIDGIHRVNCFFGSIDFLKTSGIVVLDDSNRIDTPAGDGSYKEIEDYCKEKKYEQIKFRGPDRHTDIWIKK